MKKLLTILFIYTLGISYGQQSIIDSDFNLYKELPNNFQIQSSTNSIFTAAISSLSNINMTVSLGFNGPKTACQGDTILISITADNFIGASAYQFSINFNIDKLIFVKAVNLYPLGSGFFDFNEITPGNIIILSTSFNNFGNFDNDEAFIQLSFITKDNFSACTDLILSDNPRKIEVINSSGRLPFTLNNPFTFCVTTKDCENCPTDAGEFPYRGN